MKSGANVSHGNVLPPPPGVMAYLPSPAPPSSPVSSTADCLTSSWVEITLVETKTGFTYFAKGAN